MIELSILAIAFALSFAVEWVTGRGVLATLVPMVCLAALVLVGSPDDRLLVLMIVVTLGAFGGGWGVFSARALKRRKDAQLDLMQLEKSHLVADVALEDVRVALSAWSWLLEDGRWSPLLVGAAGDVFLASPEGVFRLDTGVGELERMAEDESMFQKSLRDPVLVREWLLEPVVDELRANAKTLGPGQCYGFTILPVFEEGSYKAENRFVLPVVEHLRVTGDIHSQIKGLTDGDRVRIKVI